MKLNSSSNYSHYEIQSHILHKDKMLLFFSVCEVNGGRSSFIDRPRDDVSCRELDPVLSLVMDEYFQQLLEGRDNKARTITLT